jgi:hypothetical protein
MSGVVTQAGRYQERGTTSGMLQRIIISSQVLNFQAFHQRLSFCPSRCQMDIPLPVFNSHASSIPFSPWRHSHNTPKRPGANREPPSKHFSILTNCINTVRPKHLRNTLLLLIWSLFLLYYSYQPLSCHIKTPEPTGPVSHIYNT